jgi:hypothetical protein
MNKYFNSGLAGFLISLLMISPSVVNGQSEKAVAKKYLSEIPRVQISNSLQKYRMTAVYTNMDQYGNFSGKQKITGEYTRGLENGFVTWNNVFISGVDNISGKFPEGIKQEYIEGFKYKPSARMLEAEAFVDFPKNPLSVFAKNLIWDMGMIEDFAWNYSDTLKLNKIYIIPGISGKFEMADVGTYFHNGIQICWTGISLVNNKLCAVIEYRALDNKLEIKMDMIKTRGTEQYWGTTWVALNDKQIEHAEVYGGTVQEIEVNGMEKKFLMKTIRELWVDKIQ